MRKTILFLLATLLACGAAFAQQTQVAYTENFQSYGKNKNPNGWVDTSIGGSAANGLYKTDIDPTQGNKGTNIVFGTRQSSGRPDGNTPRIGTFSHYTTQNFSTSGRFEYTGRFIRTNADTRIGFSFCSSYPQQDQYYMVALWSRPTGGVTLQLHAFGAGTPAGRLDSNLTPDVNRWYRFRIQADDLNNQTQIRARFWQDGAPEPTTWSIDAADSGAARLKTGRIGIWSAVKGDFYVDDLAAKSPVDHTAPVVTLYESDKLLDPAVITPVNHNAILEAKVLDDISGVATVTMKVDGVAYTPRTPVTVEGLHTVRADAVDNVGNTSFLEAKVLVDKTAPVVVFTEGTRTLDATRLETFKFDPKIGIAVTDNVSTFTWAATLDGQPYVPGTPITTDAFHNLRVVATDQAQNVTDVTLRILVDKVAPVVVFSESDNVLDPSRLETFKVNPAIAIKVTDATSQATTVITLNGQPYVSGTPITIDAFYDLRVVATDQAGNVTDLTQKLLVDKLAPVIKFSAGGTTLDPASGVHEFDENVGIKIEVTDATSRATTTITLDGQPYTSETPIVADGFHEIRVIAVDEAGNSTDLTLKILVDKQPPVVVFTESGNPFAPPQTAAFARDAKIVITVTDATSETQSTITLDTQPYESGAPISVEGYHDVRVVAKDESNNVTDVTLRVLVDKSRPTIEVFEQGVKLDPATMQKFRRDAAIDIVVKDTVSTATYTATLDGNPYSTGTTIAAEGTHKLIVNAIDEAGNTEKLEIDIHVDKTAPAVKFSESGTLLDTTKVTRFKQDIHVDIDVTDNLPGVTYTSEIASPAGVQPYTSGALIHADGRHTIKVNAIDVAGNPTEAKVDLLIDQTGPVIEFREDTRTLSTDVRQEFNHLPTITIVVTDGLTTPTHTAKLDGNDFASGATVPEGKHSLVVVATDELGNVTESKLDMLVDKTAPVVVLKVGDAVLQPAGDIFNRNIKVDAQIDDISETTIEATLNGKSFELADTITEEREHELSVVVTDELDWSTPKTAKFFVDKTAPKISVFETAEGQAPLLDEKPFARAIKINATAEDLTPYTLTATIDGAQYTFGNLYDVDGPHVLVVNGVDRAGNHSEPVTLRFYIDKSKPEVTLFENGEPFPVDKTFTRDITATIDVRSATATTRTATIDGQPYTLGQPFAPEGRHEIEVVVTNIAGLSTPVKATFTIDKTNPTIQLFANGQPWQPDMKFRVDVTVTATAQDNLATAPKKKILLDDQVIDDGYVVSREDFHKISATVTDDGGLTGVAGPFDFVLDKTMPEVTVTVLVDGVAKPLASGDKFKHAITPEITIDDLTETTFTATLAANEGTPQGYQKGTEIKDDAKYSLVITVRDDLGNTNPLPAITFVVDKTPPVVLVKESDVKFEGGQFDRNLTPVIEIQDLTPTTPIATLDGEQWSSGVEITEDGDHVLNVTVTDDLGTSTVVPEIRFTIDKAGPVVTITERGNVLTDGALFNRDAQPKITITDTTASEYTATLNGETFRSEDLVTAERKHVLIVTAKDALNHTTSPDPVSFWVDKTPPLLTLTENGQPLADNAILNHDVTPLLTVVDLTPFTPVAKLDGNDFTLGNTITSEGPHVLDISVTDAVQWPATINRRFFIDKTAPVVTISVGDKLLKSGDEFGGAITPKIDITDISATTTSATLNGAEYIPGTPITADGNYVLAVTVTDAANWPTVVPPISFAIDTTAPVVKVMENGATFESGTKFKRDVEPKIIVTDLTSTTIDAKLDGNTYPLDSVISAEGRHTLTVSVTDNLGHVTPVPPIAFLLDKTAPVVSIVAAGTPMKSGDAFLSSVKPEILVTDVSATTVDAQLTSAAGVQPFVSGLEITAEGAYTLAVTVTDELDWSTPVPPIDFFVDSTAPVVELLDHHDEVLENDSWYAEPVTPKLTIVDTTPTTVSATLNGQPFNLGTQITAEGTYTLAVTVTDKVGLPAVVPPVTFTIDTTPPAITFLSPVANATLITREVVVTGDSDDAISVFVNGAQAIIDPADKKYVSPPLSLLEGPNVISAVAYDRAGNKSEPFITVTLDTRGPEIAITSPAADACLNVTQLEVKGTVFGSVTSIKVKAGAAAPVDAAIDTAGRTWTATIPAPVEGKLQLTVTGSDASGHNATVSRHVAIDRTKPVVDVLEGNLAFTATLVNRPVALTVRATDADANAALVVTLDDAPYTSGTTIAAEGLHTLKAKATDCAGLVSDEKVLTFRIDRTPPALSNLAPASGSTIGNKPSITGTVSEPATIVAEATAYTATVTGNAFTIAPALEEGLNAFMLLATDAAGNQSRLPYTVTVNSDAPAVDIVENGAPIPANALFNRNVTPVIRSNDPSATIAATLNGAPFTSGTAVTADGSYTITAKATDTFGHASETVTATFRIDKTPPTIDITQPLDGATLPSPTVNVSGTVSADARSVNVNGAPATLPGNGTFTATVTLDGFDGTIAAFAADEAGNTASDRVDVTFGGGTLAILLTSPADKLVTNRPRTVVAGQIISPADAESLTVNNTAVAFDAVGSFLVPDFALVEGENPITATVKKTGGQSNSITVVVTADFTPPVLKVFANSVELAAGARFATSPSIVLEATDNNPGVTTRLTIDGTLVTGAVALTDGGHSLTAIARDAAGNESRVDRTFFIGTSTVSTGCGLSNIDPADQSTSNTALFNGTIQINGRSGGAAAVLIDGTRAEVSEGSFCGVATLVEGRNEITIQCANADGTPTTDAPLKVVYYRYVDPVITISQPSGSAPVTEAKITVTGTVGAGVVEGNVNGIRFTVPNDGAATHNFSVPDVTLAPGLNVISARAQTTSNRGGVATVRVKLLNATPQISITSPLTGATTGATSVDVSGTYSNVDPSTITVTAGGTSVAANVVAHTDTTGTFRVSAVNLPLSLRTTITANGRNAAGVLGTASIEVEQVSTAPQITITTPADNTFLPSTATGPIHVTGTINDVPNAGVQVNGVAATLTGTSFSADVEPTSAAGGSTSIIARVTLPDGRSATDAARVIRFAGPLSVADAFPSNDATDVDPAVVILAVVSNPLDGSTVAGAFRVADSANTTVTGDLYVDRDAISFAPHQALKRGERYTATIAQSLKDAAGSTLGAAFSTSFTVATTAPTAPPTLDPIADGCFTDTIVTGRVSTPGARVQLEVDGVKVTRVSNATTGAFEIRVTFSGQPGFHSVRAREVASDGTMSAERAVCVRISCAAPRVVAASLDRAAKTLTVQFSKPMDPATLVVGAAGSIRIVPDGATALSGTLALNGVNDTATITFAEALPATSITLTVTRAAKDAGGAALAAEYTQLFTVDGAPPSASGKGYISGAVYDATRGRQLSGATILIAGEPPTVTNDQGRYASRPLPEGAYTIQASAPGRSTVWRQVVVPVGAGVLPIDIRLTERGPEATANGSAQTLAHGGDTTVTRPVELSIAAASLTTGRKVRLTSVGAQSLAGLLPLGWSPLAAAEIVVDDRTEPTPMPGAKLTFLLSAPVVQAVNSATQTLSIVQYDSERDEWRVALAAANVPADGKVAIDLTASGNYALVYADKAAHLAKPAVARAGSALAAVANPCLTTPEACLLTKIDFVLNPQAVLPNGRSTATLTTEGAGATQTYPSGTAVQAYIDEELNLADGRVLIDPPFATDLLVYRDLAGTTGMADFHLAPTPQAAAAMLRDGADHIRIVDYPGRIDRGTLIGADGGRVPGDDAVTVDIPSGATMEPLHAAVSSLSASDLASYGSIPGFRIAGGFNFTLTGTSEPQPIEGVVINPPQLIKPARATFSVSPIPTAQVIVAEVLSSTPYGVMFRMVAATTASTSVDVPGAKVYTTRAAAAGVPIGGLVRTGRYLILAADSPIAYAYGQVRGGSATGLALANARVTSGIGSPMTAALGVAELTRNGGVFVVPVAASPALPYSLQPRTATSGDGAVAVATAAPAADTFVDFGALVLSSQPPQLVSVTPDGTSEVDVMQPFVPQAVFNVAIDPASVANGIIVRNITTGTTMTGAVSAAGATVKLTPAQPLQAGADYSITVAGTIRALNGAPFGRTVIKQFRTRAVPNNTTIHPELVSITIPDANGRSTISGRAGAIPTGSQLLAVRRARNFIVSYGMTVTASDGSFSFDAGYDDPKDRITIADDIDLHVIDAISKAIIANIPLTPFVSADGRGFVAPPDRTVTFRTPDGIEATIEAGSFETRTMVRILTEAKETFLQVPNFENEVRFLSGFRLEFEGRSKKPITVSFASGPVDPARSYFIAKLDQSARGPRFSVSDMLKLSNGRLTNDPAVVWSSGVTMQKVGRIGTEAAGDQGGVLVGDEAEQYIAHIENEGFYAVLGDNPSAPIRWLVILTHTHFDLFGLATTFLDILNDIYMSFFIPGWYFADKGGGIMPGSADNTKPFTISGVDSGTGMTVFKKTYDPVAVGDEGDFVQIPNPNPDLAGPYPVFGAPFRIDAIEVPREKARVGPFEAELISTSSDPDAGNLKVTLSGSPAIDKLQPKATVRLLNPSTPASTSGPVTIDDSGNMPFLSVQARRGHRVLIISGGVDVDPGSDINVVFNEAITLPSDTGGDEEDDQAFLAEAMPFRMTLPMLNDLSKQVQYSVDSGDRRVTITLPSQMVRGATYRIVLTPQLKDKSGNPLAQGALPDGTTFGGTTEIHLEFIVRKTGLDVHEFDLSGAPNINEVAQLRDLASAGNIAFASAQWGGVLAYDLSDPGALENTGATPPTPFAVVPAHWTEAGTGNLVAFGLDEHWAVATDLHGRVYSTGFMPVFAALRTYRVEDFLVAGGLQPLPAGDPALCSAFPDAPPNANCKFYGAAVIGWRPGAISQLQVENGTIVSDRPEGIPRRMQITTQDDKQTYDTREDFETAFTTANVVDYENEDFRKFDVQVPPFTVTPNTRHYLTQRITIVNETLNMRWSRDLKWDVTSVPDRTIANVIARPNDKLTVIRNLRTYAMITLVGYGVGMFDINAIESNDYANKPVYYRNIREEVMLTNGEAEAGSPLAGSPIKHIKFSSDATLIPTAETETHSAIAVDPTRGLVGLDITGPFPHPTIAGRVEPGYADRKAGLVLKDRAANYVNPRLQKIEQRYASVGRPLVPRLSTLAYHFGSERDPDTDYLLVAGGSYGLLVFTMNNAGGVDIDLTEASLVGVVWIPGGAYGVRKVPDSNIAVVVDGRGRVLLVDVSKVDESEDVASDPAALFPIALNALMQAGEPDEVGVDDPRIIWKSEVNYVYGTLPPLYEPTTGTIFGGHLNSTKMKVTTVIDPAIRMMADLGEGSKYVGGVVPLGIAPPEPFAAAIEASDSASMGAFRLEVTLPGGVARTLEDMGRTLSLAVESEGVLGAVTQQTSVALPPSHLRSKTRVGTNDARNLPLPLQRRVPRGTTAAENDQLEKLLRHQSGYNSFLSPWVVAVADPRAGVRYRWTYPPTAGSDAAKKQYRIDEGCSSCQRPDALKNKTEDDGVYEIWTNGRFLAVRPDANVFNGTPYQYLGENGRMSARFTTIMADIVRPESIRVAGQNPPEAEGLLDETAYVHSGELEIADVDLSVEGRGEVEIEMERTYRSRMLGGSLLGLGWDATFFRRLRQLPGGNVEYRDGEGEVWLFKKSGDDSDAEGGEIGAGTIFRYDSPKGLFLKLVRTAYGWTMFDQQWRITTFDELGRLASESDEFFDPSSADPSGNRISYLYDETGKLSQIIDPVGRVTKLKYWLDTDPAPPLAAGLLRSVTDWRVSTPAPLGVTDPPGRSVEYEYDVHGRLKRVRLPEFGSTGTVSGYTYEGTSRPTIEYNYQTPAVPTSEGAESQVYTDFLELGNLIGVKDPAQFAASGGLERAQFGYDGTTQFAFRDRLKTQTWPCGTNAPACTSRVAEFTYDTPLQVKVKDMLGLERTHILTDPLSAENRRHIDKLIVPTELLDSASGTPTATASTATEPLTTDYDYNDEGMVTKETEPSGLVTDRVYGYAGNGAPGQIISSMTENPPSGSTDTARVTGYTYDTAPNAVATITKITKTGDGFGPVSRDEQTASRDRMNVEEDDEGVRTTEKYNALGQLTDIEVSKPTPPAGVTIRTHIDYWPNVPATPKIAIGKPMRVTSGGANPSQYFFTYLALPLGGERVTMKDEIRGTNTITETDAYGRETLERVEDESGNTLTEEKTAYNRDGDVAYEWVKQTNVADAGDFVETHYDYDALGRLTATRMTKARVGASSSADLKTKITHNLATREITEIDPHTDDGSTTPREVMHLDFLGRLALLEHRNAPSMPAAVVAQRLAYDKHGEVAYESDTVLVAERTEHDAFGRERRTISSDGTKVENKWNAWDELVEESELSSSGALTSKTVNAYSLNGRLRRTADQVDLTGRSRLVRHTWDDGDANRTMRVGAVNSPNSDFDPFDPVRVIHTRQDSAGRDDRVTIGAGTGPDGLLSSSDVYVQVDTTYVGDLPVSETTIEPRAGKAVSSTMKYDTLGRLTSRTDAGTLTETMVYDEADNVTEYTAVGLPVEKTKYDSRGLPFHHTKSDGSQIEREYDALGILRSFKDEQGHVTTFDVDSLGRVKAVTYLGDSPVTSELIEYEAGSGRVSARRDRRDQWLSFKYDVAGRIKSIHPGPTTGTAAETEYDYDDAGRLIRVRNRDAAIEYDNFDLLGRPGLTRTIRYQNHSGLATAIKADVHTQEHRWSVFDDERSRWRMPVAGETLPSTEPNTAWRSWIDETYDAVANLTRQTEELSASTPASGAVVTEAIARGIARLVNRKRPLTGPEPLLTRYGYAEGAPAGPASVPVEPSAGGDPDGVLGRVLTAIGTTGPVVAGNQLGRNSQRRINHVVDFGTGRESAYAYDSRGRLTTANLGASATATPFVSMIPSAADFISDRIVSGRVEDPVGFEAAVPGVQPLSWKASSTDAYAHIDKAGYVATPPVFPLTPSTFAYSGGHRTKAGHWSFAYDEHGRLTSMWSDVAGRKIDYQYDPRDRVIARIALQPDTGGLWTLETRANVLARDGLPADTTWVWDPITDRLTAMYASGASIPSGTASVDAEAGLLRQYLHGDQSYDDPVEVLVRQPDNSVKRYLPVVDEAGSGSLTAVLDDTGNLVERVVYADAYGDAPRFLTGASVDRVALKNAGGNREIRLHLSEVIRGTTVNAGARLYAIDSSGNVLSEREPTTLEEGRTIVWSVNDWAVFTTGAEKVEFVVTAALRAEGWSDAPIQSLPAWAESLYGSVSDETKPFSLTYAVTELSDRFSAPDASTDEGSAILEIHDLYLLASEESRAKLHFDFDALPFREPATQLVYARARWYDPSTASFLTPDPEGYEDSSNLYAFAGNDPLNATDATGESRSLRTGSGGRGSMTGGRGARTTPKVRSTRSKSPTARGRNVKGQKKPLRAKSMKAARSKMVKAARAKSVKTGRSQSVKVARSKSAVGGKKSAGSAKPKKTFYGYTIDSKGRLRDTDGNLAPTGPAEPYNRLKHYGRTPTGSDRKAMKLKSNQVADHDPPLVKRYYEGDPKRREKPGYLMTDAERRASGRDRTRMHKQPRADSNKQGGEMSKYSREQRKKYFGK